MKASMPSKNTLVSASNAGPPPAEMVSRAPGSTGSGVAVPARPGSCTAKLSGTGGPGTVSVPTEICEAPTPARISSSLPGVRRSPRNTSIALGVTDTTESPSEFGASAGTAARFKKTRVSGLNAGPEPGVIVMMPLGFDESGVIAPWNGAGSTKTLADPVIPAFGSPGPVASTFTVPKSRPVMVPVTGSTVALSVSAGSAAPDVSTVHVGATGTCAVRSRPVALRYLKVNVCDSPDTSVPTGGGSVTSIVAANVATSMVSARPAAVAMTRAVPTSAPRTRTRVSTCGGSWAVLTATIGVLVEVTVTGMSRGVPDPSRTTASTSTESSTFTSR